MAEETKLAKMVGVMYEAGYACSIQSTWCLYQLATIVPFIACVRPVPLPITWICGFLF